MKKSASGGTTQGNAIRGRESGYESRHYVIEDPSDSLEYSASDFAIAQFARTQGDTATYNSLMTRAQWWINTWNPESAYVSRHNSDGTFAWPVDPASDAGLTEGNPAQYTWMVTYNFSGLINLMGGRQTAVQRLNHHFTQVNGGLTTPFFYIGNEPEHGVPWAYNFAGNPAGTADAVHKVQSQGFNTTGGGTLSYTLGASPGSWGTGAGDVPPSFNDGFTPPPPAPNLGTNVAQGKPTTASAVCAASESSDKAVDGSLANNSKWCSLTAPMFLQVDLGSTQNVSSFVIKHAGLGGENTRRDNRAYTHPTRTHGPHLRPRGAPGGGAAPP